MINCNKVTKKYQNQIVLDNFTYNFKSTGFYLLFGESGSGKTTFINILSGMTAFDGGNISIDNNEFDEMVSKEIISFKADYITQDTFFIDFLNVFDNLRMVNNDDEYIKKMLVQFNLVSKIEQYPMNLSGGEKQRLSIVRALLSGKKILFLDEPTASLDFDNKIKVFEMLSEIKDRVLIICSSHDLEVKKYADEVIQFEKKHKLCEVDNTHESKKIVKRKKLNAKCNKSRIQKNREYFFLKKWFVSKKRNKKNKILFSAFLTIAICMCLLSDTPENRLESNMEYVYKVNMCMLQSSEKDTEIYQRLCDEKGVKEVVLDYGLNVPTGEILEEEGEQIIEGDYEVNVPVLPYASEAFKLSDKVKYGNYFTGKNQIILSAEMAESLCNDSPEKLIGQKLTKKFYGIGEIELEIIGIFDYFNDFEKMYLKAMGIKIYTGENYNKNDYSDLWFINGKFTEQYVYDTSFYSNEQRVYTLYFDSYSDMKDYYDTNNKVYDEKGDWLHIGLENSKYLGIFDLFYKVTLPLSYFIAFFTILFYINLQKTELAYNNKFISVFDYAGYDVGRVVRCFMYLNLLEVLKICCISTIVGVSIAKIINIINEKCIFFEFQIFSYNVEIILIFEIFLIIISCIFIYTFMRKYKYVSWYENIIKNRDLL